MFRNWIIRNILLAFGLFILSLILSYVALNFYTRHASEIEVPNLLGMSLSEASQVSNRMGFKLKVVDSVYVRSMRKAEIYSQRPLAKSHIKEGRTVSLVINASSPKMISMPNLVGLSIRQAKSKLSSLGLKLGRLKYVEDIATNDVLKQLYEGREVAKGERLSSESVIDLVVGLNSEDNMTLVPELTGMTYLRAIDLLRRNSLNIGDISFLQQARTYTDTISSVVVAQRPDAAGEAVYKGTEISLVFDNKEE